MPSMNELASELVKSKPIVCKLHRDKEDVQPAKTLSFSKL